MNVVHKDHSDQTAVQSDDLTLTYRQEQPQRILPDEVGNGYIKEEPLEDQDSDVSSENLSELPPNLLAKVPNSKRIYGCVRKQCQGVTIYLLDNDVWQIFCAEGNEMIITKKGRRMFPVPSFLICDLDNDKLYKLSLEINAVDNHVYKFANGKWVPTKEGSFLYPTPVPGRDTSDHHLSLNTGSHWMKEPVSFATLKISNNLDAQGTIVLQSMRKYVMVLIICEREGRSTIRIRLPETMFVAVTQYQNDNITKMKIEHNPFANAFRTPSGKSKDKEKSKRQRPVEPDSEDEVRTQEVSSTDQIHAPTNQMHAPTNQMSALTGQLFTENLRVLGRPDIWSTNMLQMSAYLEHNRHMFQNLLPPGSDRLNMTSPQRVQSINNNVVSWPHGLPPQPLGLSLYTSPPVPEMPLDGRLMFPFHGINPLAEVRQFGENNRCSDFDVPLSLVKKMKPDLNTMSNECSNNSKPQNCRQSPKNKRRLPVNLQNEEPGSYQQMQLPTRPNTASTGLANIPSPYSRLAPDVETMPLFSSEGLLRPNSAGPRGDVSSHNREMSSHNREMSSPKDGKILDIKTGRFPPMNPLSRRPVDIENMLPQREEAATLLTTTRNHNSSISQCNNSPAMARPEVILRNSDLWATTNEVVLSSRGRPMFPFISLRVNKMHPEREYSISLKLALCSTYLYGYSEHQWEPLLQVAEGGIDAIYPHPDNPKDGHQWGSEVNFDKLRLSTVKQGKNVLKLQVRRQYLPHVIIETDTQLWEFPLKDAKFITVKIDRSNNGVCGQNVKPATSRSNIGVCMHNVESATSRSNNGVCTHNVEPATSSPEDQRSNKT